MFKIESPQIIYIDEFIFLRSKTSSFNCNDGKTNKLKGISKYQSKHIKFEEQKNVQMDKKAKKNVISIF